MSSLTEKPEELEFKWGKPRGLGGKNKDVRFYESFTFDGTDYTLYDCVYMSKEGEPYIGKLVKIWLNSDGSKKIKVHWFFRPSEISYYLTDAVFMENELFFASGEGTGLANINPLEAIAGKCNVVCISKDSRNPQPLAEELEMADYVFYRIFDVKNCTISDQMDDTVGGLEVKYLFNRTDCVSSPDVRNLNSKGKDVMMTTSRETMKIAGKNPLQKSKNLKTDENVNHVLEKEDSNAKDVHEKKGSSFGACMSGDHANSSKVRKISGISLDKKSMLGDTTVGCKGGSEKDKSEVKVDERVKYPRNAGDLEGAQPKKARLDGIHTSLEVKDANIAQSPTIPENDGENIEIHTPLYNGNPKIDFDNNLDGLEKDGKLDGGSSLLDEKLSKTSGSPSEGRSKHVEGSVRLGKDGNLNKDSNALQGNQSKGDGFLSGEKLELPHPKDSIGIENDKKLGENLCIDIEKPSKNNVASRNETPKLGCNKDLQGKLVQNPNASMKKPMKRSIDISKEKLNTPLAKDVSPLGGPPTKKGKFDASVKMSEDCNNIGNSKEKHNKSSRLVANDITIKSKLDKGDPKKISNDKVGNHSKKDLPTPSTTLNGDDGEVGRRVFEVTPRPIVEKSNWMKLNWEDRMKAAHDQGRLVLFQNLDPKYTSGEVEDIVWHAFKEECSAKLVQHIAISNPYSGQAFGIFKTREAVDKVLKNLDAGCLLLPNHRPLLVRTVDFPKFLEKQTTLVGHLAIDKARRQVQRDMKEAVATSHYSQNNTIEYEMAMSWCLLQLKSDKWWTTLYKQQQKEVKKLAGEFKSK